MIKQLFLFLFLMTLAQASAKPLRTYAFDGKCPHLSLYLQYLEDCNKLSEEAVLEAFYKGDFKSPEPNKTFNMGFTTCSYWLVVDVKNITPREQKMIWSFYNNGLEFSFYELQNNKLVFLQKGSMHQSISDRPYPVRSISFPFFLQHNESKILFVKVSPTIHNNVYFPTDITNVEDYLFYEIDYSLIMGKFFGLFWFTFFLNLVLFLVLKIRLHLYNALYILFIILSQLADFHFDSLEFKSFYFVHWSYINKMTYIVLAMFFYTKIFQHYTNQIEIYPKGFKIIRKWSFILLIVTLILYFSSSLFEQHNSVKNTIDTTIYFINMFGFIVVFGTIFYGVLQRKKYFIQYFISVIPLHYAFLSYILSTQKLVQLPVLEPGNTINGLTFQIAIITILSVFKYKSEKEKLAKLKLENARINENLALEIVRVQENERKLIAQELHDEVGSRLTGVRLKIQDYFRNNPTLSNQDEQDKDKIIANLNLVYEEVRNMSHLMMPKYFEEVNFIKNIEDHIVLLQSNYPKIQFNFNHNITAHFNLDASKQSHLYRVIIELLFNAIKHAKASHIHIQIYSENDTLECTIEDDGIGFEKNNKTTGIGLENAKTRIQFLKGTFISIQTPMVVFLTFKFQQNEKSIHHIYSR